MIKFSNSGDVASGAKNLQFNKADKPVKGIILRFKGTNKTGQQLTASNIDAIKVNRNGEPIVYLRPITLKKLNNLMYGTVLQSSTAGGSFDLNFIIPFYNPLDKTDKNAIDLGYDDYVEVPQLPSTVVSDATCEVYLWLEDSPTRYIPYLIERSYTLSENVPIELLDRNIWLLGFTEPTTPPSNVLLTRDGIEILNSPYAMLETFTNAISNIESGTEDYVLLSLGTFETIFGHRYTLTLTGASGTLYYFLFSVNYTAGVIVPPSTIPFPGRAVQSPVISPVYPERRVAY
jgi:hypothetical protein